MQTQTDSQHQMVAYLNDFDCNVDQDTCDDTAHVPDEALACKFPQKVQRSYRSG